MSKPIIPQQFVDHLQGGGLLFLVATPLVKSFKPVTFAVDLRHIYQAHILPIGGYTKKEPLETFEEGTTAREILDTFIGIILEKTPNVGGAVALDIIVAKDTKQTFNQN